MALFKKNKEQELIEPKVPLESKNEKVSSETLDLDLLSKELKKPKSIEKKSFFGKKSKKDENKDSKNPGETESMNKNENVKSNTHLEFKTEQVKKPNENLKEKITEEEQIKNEKESDNSNEESDLDKELEELESLLLKKSESISQGTQTEEGTIPDEFEQNQKEEDETQNMESFESYDYSRTFIQENDNNFFIRSIDLKQLYNQIYKAKDSRTTLSEIYTALRNNIDHKKNNFDKINTRINFILNKVLDFERLLRGE